MDLTTNFFLCDFAFGAGVTGTSGFSLAAAAFAAAARAVAAAAAAVRVVVAAPNAWPLDASLEASPSPGFLSEAELAGAGFKAALSFGFDLTVAGTTDSSFAGVGAGITAFSFFVGGALINGVSGTVSTAGGGNPFAGLVTSGMGVSSTTTWPLAGVTEASLDCTALGPGRGVVNG